MVDAYYVGQQINLHLHILDANQQRINFDATIFRIDGQNLDVFLGNNKVSISWPDKPTIYLSFHRLLPDGCIKTYCTAEIEKYIHDEARKVDGFEPISDEKKIEMIQYIQQKISKNEIPSSEILTGDKSIWQWKQFELIDYDTKEYIDENVEITI